jgi:parvulin-like peptidyl-prolyl isomerase
LSKKKNVVKVPREMTHRQLSHHKRQQRRQRIIFISGIGIIAAVVIIIILGWVLGEYRPLHRTVIRVYDSDIRMVDFVDTIKVFGRNTDVTQLQENISGITNTIINNELIRQGGEQLGVTVSDEEVENALQGSELPDNKATRDLIRAELLPDKIRDNYFGARLSVSDNQVYIMALLAESENIVPEIRDRLMSGDNFTMLAEQYAQNYTSKKVNKGDYGWHPASILKDLLGSDIPINWAFSAQPGDISPALKDAESYKQWGYWLLRVNDIPDAGTANVSALLLSSEFEAKEMKMRLESGSESLAAIADTYSQYSPSKEGHGELGLVASSENISDTFNKYVYNPDVQLGVWSDPISETIFYTKGGAWLVQLIDKDNDRKLSDEDRETLINKAYNDWANNLWAAASADIINNLTDEEQQWAFDRAIKELQKS